MDDMRIRAKVCSQKKITDRELIVMEYYKLLDVPWRSRTKRSSSPWDPRSVLWIEARGSWQKVKRRLDTSLGGCSNIKRTGGCSLESLVPGSCFVGASRNVFLPLRGANYKTTHYLLSYFFLLNTQTLPV